MLEQYVVFVLDNLDIVSLQYGFKRAQNNCRLNKDVNKRQILRRNGLAENAVHILAPPATYKDHLI